MTSSRRLLLAVALLVSFKSVQAQTGIVAFSQANFTASDTDDVALVTVNFNGTSNIAATIDFATTNGTAIAGQDYTAAALTLDLSSGISSTNISIQIFTGTLDSNLTVNLSLKNPTGNAALGSLSNAVLTIVATGGGGGPVPEGVHVFPIELRGLLITDTGSNQVVKLAFTERALTSSERLVLVLDLDSHMIHLGTVDADNFLTFLASSTHAAFLSNGQFGGNLETEDLTLFNSKIDSIGTGDLQIKGSFRTGTGGALRLNRASLLGVFNDSFNGNSGEVDALLKADISQVGKELDVDELEFPE